MFVSEKLVFLQMQKCAGTHIAALLERHIGGERRGKHSPLAVPAPEKLVVGSIRNPWDWYVSLWAYGCSDRGGVQGRLKKSRAAAVERIMRTSYSQPERWRPAWFEIKQHLSRDVEFWRDCYADANDAAAFRRWLIAILSPEGQRFMGADYAERPLAEFMGFFTYRFATVFTPKALWQKHAASIRAPADVAAFLEAHCAVQRFIRTERLEDDLAAVLAEIGRPDITAETLRGDRINASRRKGMDAYYDSQTLDLVARAESALIAKFDYAPPGEICEA